MKIVIAPDSFKGSLSAPQACQALELGARRVFPDAEFLSVPFADGGEGTLDILMSAATGIIKSSAVRGPLCDTVEAQWGILPDGRAAIEMARASGLDLISPQRRNALTASSFGTGQLIGAALNAGCREIIIAIGGSATTDGGVGALSVLSLRARDNRERVLPPGGGALAQLATLDPKLLDGRLKKSTIKILCDVDNPLYGPNGAAHIYSLQKGASPSEVELLDAALRHYAASVARITGCDNSSHAGSGAAGGLGFGLMAFCNVEICSGVEVVIESTDFANKIKGADLILAGEGRLDEQTLKGKVIAGICALARERNVPVIAYGGSIELNGAQMNDLGLTSAFSLTSSPCDLAFCLDNASSLLANSVENSLRLWRSALA